MTTKKVCKQCNMIYEGDKCPNCDKKDVTDTFKGKVEIVNPEKSELAKELKISKKGLYAIKV